MRIPSGVTDQVIYFVAVDSTDLKTRETGLSSFTVYRDRNGAGAAAMTTPTVTEVDAVNMPGVYKLLLDEDMAIGAGNDSEEMCFHITAAGMAPVTRTIELYRPKITAGDTLATTGGKLDEVSALTDHVVQTGDSYARIGAVGAGLTGLGGMSASMKAEVNAEADTALTDYDAVVPADLPTNFADLAITVTTGRVTVGTSNDKTGYSIAGTKTTLDALNDLTAAQVNAEVDTALADINLDHFIPVAGTVDDVSPTSLDFDTDLTEASTNHYDDMVISFASGALSGQSRRISLYSGGSKNVAVFPNFTAAPANGDAFVIVSGVYLRTTAEDLGTTAKTAVLAKCAVALADIGLDHLLSVAVTGADVADDSAIAQLVSKSATADWDTFDNTTDSLEAVRDRGDAAWSATAGNPNVLIDTTVATVTSQTIFTLSAGPADDDALINQAVVLYDASSTPADSPSVRKITDYVAATKTVTIDVAPDFTILAGDGVKAFVTAPGTTAPTAAQVADAVWDELVAGHVVAASFGEELHLAKAVLANKAEHDTATSANQYKDNDGATALLTLTPTADDVTGLVTRTPS